MITEQTFKTSFFYQEAKNYIESPEPIEDRRIAIINQTQKFYGELYNILKARESINININANVRKGKSTVAIAIGKRIQEMMIQLGMTKDKFAIKNIARTQYELSKKLRDVNLSNTVIVIDEFDDMEETGENATVDQALLRHFSKIQAGRYIHKIYCSPANNPDSESNIIIDVIQPDKETGLTHCRLSTKIYKAGLTYTQLIGHINIDVNDIIKVWKREKIEEIFYKKDKTKQEIEKIKKCRKQDFYTDYMCRKFERMDIVNEKGIFRTKILDYADIILEAVEKLFDLTKLGGVQRGFIKNTIKRLSRKHKIPQSIVGEDLMIQSVDGSLYIWTEFYTLKKKIKKAKTKEEIEILKAGIKSTRSLGEEDLKELHYLSKIKEEFYKE